MADVDSQVLGADSAEMLDGSAPPAPPEVVPAQIQPCPEVPSNAATRLLRRLLRLVGIDRAIGFTVLARGWTSLAGVVTLTLIAHFLTPAEQGYYYTFYSLVALQIVFELGFSVVILQSASHEAAHLVLTDDGTVSGPERAHSRLASILQKSVRWYSVAAVLMAVFLLPAGFHFFRTSPAAAAGQHIAWAPAWILIVFATMCTFQVDPIFSFLEGCGYVPQIARTRLQQAMLGTALGWTALLTHHGLLAPGCVIGGQALAGARFIFTKRHLLMPLLRRDVRGEQIHWGTEVWPFQWRIAVSWLCGYFTFQIFNPILFKYRGAVEAGQMGMTLNVCNTMSSVAVAWMNTKAAPFGRMIALRQFRKLDHEFRIALMQSTAAAVLGAIFVWFLDLYLTDHRYPVAHRLLPLVPLAMLLYAMIGNLVVAGEALYLRAHKQEKFMVNSIVGALYICPVALWMGLSHAPHAGAWGIAAATAVGVTTIGLGYGTYTFLHWRSIWHAE